MRIQKYIVLYCILYYNTKYKIQLFNTISHTRNTKMAITREQILETASSLQTQGIKPTQTNVREALGGGSFTTIAEALREWRQEQDQTAQLQQVVIPSDITDRTQVLIAQVWETAQTLANDRLVKEREALEHKEALINAEIDESNKIIETLENEQAELTNQLDTLNNDNSLLITKNNELENLNNSLNTQLTTEKARSHQLQLKLDEQNAKIERLTADLATAQATATNATTQATEHAQRADQAIAELQAVNIENARLQGKSDTLADQLTKSEALTANQAEKITSLSAQVARLEQIEKENNELKRVIESNKKIDEKQQSLLDQPQATKNPKTTK